MSKEDGIRNILDEAVQEIAEAQNNPRSWLSWMIYLLAHLEDRAARESPTSRESFLEMLSALQDEIRNRKRTGGWH